MLRTLSRIPRSIYCVLLIVWSITSPVSFGSALAERGETGAIVGHVFGAVPGKDGVPLPGAVLHLFDGDSVIAEAVTNDDGFYAMENVPPGKFGLHVVAEGYQPQGVPVVVEPGEVTERNFLLIPIGEPGAIVGHVLGAVPGNDPIPLPGAVLHLFHGDHVIAEAVTNDDGFYAMEMVPPGLHGLHVVAEGYHPQGGPVVVEPGEVTERNFLLIPAEPGFGAIAGYVFATTPDGGEVPLPGAVLRLFHAGKPVAEMVTNEHGFYLFKPVPAGEYGLLAMAEGFEPQGVPVVVHPGHVTERNFLLLPVGPGDPGAIVGHVFGMAPDGGEVPLPGAVLHLFHAGKPVAETITNVHGFYVFKPVPPGGYGLLAVAEGFEPQDAFVVVQPGHVTEQNFLLIPAGELGAIVGHVLGAVPGGGAVPLPGAVLHLVHDGSVVAEAVTNDDGFYAMEGLPPGMFGLHVIAEGYHPQGVPVVVQPGHVTERNFLLMPAEMGAIAGHVFGIDPDLGEIPLAGALVRLFHEGKIVAERLTNEGGFYTFVPVPPGEYGLLAAAKGYQPQDALVVVEAGSVTKQHFLLIPGEPGGIAAPPTGDLDRDGVVDPSDLAVLLGNWGNPGTTDLNGDGTTDPADLAILLSNWG